VSTSMTELTVDDVMLAPEQIPVLNERALLKVALEEMTRRRLGIVCITGEDRGLLGIFTDGDVRRMLLRDQKPFSALFADDVIKHAVRNPTTTKRGTLLSDAVMVMEERAIWDLPVVDQENRLVGLLHLHPAVKALLEI